MGPPPGPPPKSTSGALIALLVGGGLVVVLLIAVVVVFAVRGGEDMTPAERLNAAARNVSSARAVTYNGSFGSLSRSLSGELKLTRSGRIIGNVTAQGSQITVLSVDDRLYVKAERSYWLEQLGALRQPYFLKNGTQWGKVAPTEVDLSFKRKLTPSALASEMRSSASYRLRSSETTVKGRKAVRVSSSLATFYLTDSDSPELLRYESTYPRVAADVTVQSGGTGAATVTQIRNTIGELKDSFDTRGQPSLIDTEKGLCSTNSNSCRVRGRVRPPLGTNSTTRIEVRYTLRAGTTTGRELGNCTTTVTVSSSQPVWAECRVSGAAWRSWSRSGETRYYVSADFRVPGATDADIREMQSALAQD
ncbi:hypothetical protein Arub01_41490 [Actinomadura rubrobrunea]|uniref:Uncharacterized protein n=1 Tax=Actinomadura rubrobrunea TaxID=115335 RepID=A0A9W6PWW6_9ACTN|nr:hypothetical protein [Actinomadura rubrobrunea]GLW65905.1 hypothetical protein Arub01_41490 [Actinomadura rubrobrunea]